jgi:hypothetical protein
MRVSPIERSNDLRKYNVLILPGGSPVSNGVKKWVEDGGTLIALGEAAYSLARKDSKFSSVRRQRDVLDKLTSIRKTSKENDKPKTSKSTLTTSGATGKRNTAGRRMPAKRKPRTRKKNQKNRPPRASLRNSNASTNGRESSAHPASSSKPVLTSGTGSVSDSASSYPSWSVATAL